MRFLFNNSKIKKNIFEKIKTKTKKKKKREKRLSLDKGGNFFENVGFSGPILWQKKKTCVFIFYIYKFYFENLIFKWIK